MTWFIFSGALLTAGSFFAKEVYQEHLSDRRAGLERQIDEAANIDRQPLSEDKIEAIVKACEVTDRDVVRREDALQREEAIFDLGAKLADCRARMDAVSEEYHKLRTATNDLSSEVKGDERQRHAISDFVKKLGVADKTVARYKEASVTGTICQDLLNSMNQERPIDEFHKLLDGASAANCSLTMAVYYNDIFDAYRLAVKYRESVIDAAHSDLRQQEGRSDLTGYIVIALFIIGWASHLYGSITGVKIDAGA